MFLHLAPKNAHEKYIFDIRSLWVTRDARWMIKTWRATHLYTIASSVLAATKMEIYPAVHVHIDVEHPWFLVEKMSYKTWPRMNEGPREMELHQGFRENLKKAFQYQWLASRWSLGFTEISRIQTIWQVAGPCGMDFLQSHMDGFLLLVSINHMLWCCYTWVIPIVGLYGVIVVLFVFLYFYWVAGVIFVQRFQSNFTWYLSAHLSFWFRKKTRSAY